MNKQHIILSRQNRNYVMAWTSLWIFVPLLFKHKEVEIMYSVLLILSGCASLNHWFNNISNDWRHKLDVYIAISTSALFTDKLYSSSIQLAIYFQGSMLFFFMLQRYMQLDQQINWKNVLISHCIFRYIGFWMAMVVMSKFNLSIFEFVIISIIYIMHVISLSITSMDLKYYSKYNILNLQYN